MVVSAKHEVDADRRERAEHLARVLEAVSSGQLALYRIVMHDDHACIVRRRALKLLASMIDLRAMNGPDDGDVAKPPRERVTCDAVCRVQTDERRAGHAQHRLEILRDVPPVIFVRPLSIADSERSFPPQDVVIARHDDRPAHPVRVADEGLSPLELSRACALREVTRDRDDVEPACLDDRLDRFDLSRYEWATEMQVRD